MRLSTFAVLAASCTLAACNSASSAESTENAVAQEVRDTPEPTGEVVAPIDPRHQLEQGQTVQLGFRSTPHGEENLYLVPAPGAQGVVTVYWNGYEYYTSVPEGQMRMDRAHALGSSFRVCDMEPVADKFRRPNCLLYPAPPD